MIDNPHTPPTQAERRIYTRCPSCHNDTLTLNNGHLLCTWHECKDPTAIDTIWKYTPRDSVMDRTGADQIARLTKEVEELRKDKERLDWLEANMHTSPLRLHKKRWACVGFTNYEYEVYQTARIAIDAAMQQKGEE
jgi:hypothetical protein